MALNGSGRPPGDLAAYQIGYQMAQQRSGQRTHVQRKEVHLLDQNIVLVEEEMYIEEGTEHD
ncbi:hypothetical protein [Mycolicibacterium fluoranthenivorans]|jgi:hypothetical protein|uniref:Uncharacterized protein n=1 Tax=Mycolicibacterium fluoranthenivorans TaxID=258505 RepID=A0A1G4WRK2_9MYCO|nr:hypothetical protein [Mycolicibacterium fluoranthenivorans]SCX28099.1 hypothetical protein SAMN02799620_04523 [Mycolicibacterium fluoranthenivorans]